MMVFLLRSLAHLKIMMISDSEACIPLYLSPKVLKRLLFDSEVPEFILYLFYRNYTCTILVRPTRSQHLETG